MRALLILLLVTFAATGSASAAEPKRVLLLHSFGPQFVPWVFFAGQFREELFRLSPDKIDLYEASLEGARFQQPAEERPIVDYLASLFGQRKLDLIVTIGAPATIFVQKHRSQFFPSIPLVIGGPERRAINYDTLTPYDAPVPVALDFADWIKNILQVLPETTHIAWAVGASPLEKFWTEECRRVSQPFADKISFEYFNDLRFEDMLDRVSKLPPHSAVFYLDLRVDAAGVPLDRESVLPKLRAATNAPIFSYVDNYLGQGIVGGPMMSSGELGRRMAEAAIRILGGTAPVDVKMPALLPGAPQYDWRELQHWNIPESRLPAGSIVRFREPTVWEQYRWQIMLACAIVLVQAALISLLLHERRRRQFAELQSKQRMSELAHTNRYSMAGELTASIAHEINQPLGSILTNAETAEVMLKSPAPDMNELGEIIADIRRDDQRASEVILRLRSLLKKAPFELKDFDLNDLVGETIELLSGVAVARGVRIDRFMTAVPLPVSADRVQLQQVLINLMINAMDAMMDLPGPDREMSVYTARVDKLAQITVSDSGPGIPQDERKQIFEPFFTTKPQGMGMGLSIARTILEAHHGQLSAENHAGGGAVFRVRLPIMAAAETP
jgi:signal transduction histidine kinase